MPGSRQLSRDVFSVRSKAATEKESRLKAEEYMLSGRAAAIKAPLLIVAGKRDNIVGWQGACRLGPSVLSATR